MTQTYAKGPGGVKWLGLDTRRVGMVAKVGFPGDNPYPYSDGCSGPQKEKAVHQPHYPHHGHPACQSRETLPRLPRRVPHLDVRHGVNLPGTRPPVPHVLDMLEVMEEPPGVVADNSALPDPWDDVQVQEEREISLATRDLLVERANRLAEALERVMATFYSKTSKKS